MMVSLTTSSLNTTFTANHSWLSSKISSADWTRPLYPGVLLLWALQNKMEVQKIEKKLHDLIIPDATKGADFLRPNRYVRCILLMLVCTSICTITTDKYACSSLFFALFNYYDVAHGVAFSLNQCPH